MTDTATEPHYYTSYQYGKPCITCHRVPREHTWPGETPMDNSRISVTAWIYPSEKMIRSHVYEDGRAMIEINDHNGTEVQIWVASQNADLDAERAALLKLADTASRIVHHLDGLIAKQSVQS